MSTKIRKLLYTSAHGVVTYLLEPLTIVSAVLKWEVKRMNLDDRIYEFLEKCPTGLAWVIFILGGYILLLTLPIWIIPAIIIYIRRWKSKENRHE